MIKFLNKGGINTSDATATANDILAPKTAYVNDEKVTGAIIPTYGQSVPKQLDTHITWDSSINLWDVSYNKKIAVINSGGTGFGLVKIINDSVDYTTRVDYSRENIEIPSNYTIIDCKISSTSTDTIILWVIGRYVNVTSGDDYNYHSITRCVIKYSDLSVESFKTTTYQLGNLRTSIYYCLPRPDHDEDLAVIVGYCTVRSSGGTYRHNRIRVRLYTYDESGDSFLTKLDYDATVVSEEWNRPDAVWGYWTDNGKYLLSYGVRSTTKKRCTIHKIEPDNTITLMYNGTTQRRILNNGCYVQGVTVYAENDTIIGTSELDFSNETTNLSMLYPLIFVRNSNILTYLLQVKDDNNIIKMENISTNSNKSFTEANKAYWYNTGKLSGYGSELSLEIIGMRRANIDYHKLYEATGTSSDVLSGKKVYNNSGLITGSMPNNGAINITPSNAQQTIPAGYTSGGIVAAVNNQTKFVTPTTSQQIITPDNGYNGIGQVNVSAVDNTVDENIVAGNIKNGVTILGVTGTLPTNARTFATIEEMEAYTGATEDDYAIVYGTTYIGTYRYDNGNWTQIGDSSQEQEIMDILNDVMDTTEQYEGNGGTDTQINAVLDNILGIEEVV